MAELLQIDSTIKAIVSSGYSNDPVLSNCKEYGFQAKLEKPFNMEKLENILDSI